MTKLGPYIVVKAAEFPFFERVHKLARCLTPNQVEDILKMKAHIHRNPGKRKGGEKDDRLDSSVHAEHGI